jgi:hypothetical protein
VSASNADDTQEGVNDACALPDRPPQKFLPSQPQVLALLSMAVIQEERGSFRERFGLAASLDQRGSHRERFSRICNIPISWIAQAYGCDMPYRLRHAGDMFPDSGIESAFANEFYVMDVILNRAMSPDGGGVGKVDPHESPDRVVLMRSSCPEDNDD